jgi:hypothetical protein
MTYFGELFGRFSDEHMMSCERAGDGGTKSGKAGAHDGDVEW